MKTKPVIISAILFGIINTSYFWENQIGFWLFPVIICLGILYLALVIILISKIISFSKSTFRNKEQLKIPLIILTTLVLVGIFPNGMIDFQKFESKNVLIARREGVAGCAMYLTLKENREFMETESCFGIHARKGKYKIKGDTIVFSFYDTRLQNADTSIGITHFKGKQNQYAKNSLQYYRNSTDSIPMYFEITKNDLP